MSDRYTALGQFDVDMEYFIASPADSPRHTMRWGVRLNNGHNGILEGLGEYQDLLHLRLPGDGVYYVAFYPRMRGTAAPAFTTLGNGTVIKVAGDFGTDYGFLAADPSTVTADGITFSGTSASAQARAGETLLALGTDGLVRADALGIQSAAAVSVRFSRTQIVLDLPADHPVQSVDLRTPGTLSAPKGVKCVRTDTGWRLTVPAGMVRVVVAVK
jgi:hypothetical protein